MSPEKWRCSLCWGQLNLHLSILQQMQATALLQWQVPVVSPRHGRTKKLCQMKLQELRFF